MNVALLLAVMSAVLALAGVALSAWALLTLPRRGHVRTDPACRLFAGPGRWLDLGPWRIPSLRHWLFMRGRGRCCRVCVPLRAGSYRRYRGVHTFALGSVPEHPESRRMREGIEAAVRRAVDRERAERIERYRAARARHIAAELRLAVRDRLDAGGV